MALQQQERIMKSHRIATCLLATLVTSLGCQAANSMSTPQGGLPKSADSLHWVNYTDNAEGAFSMDIPLGWQINGGMYRFGYFDVRWMMDARSLDGNVIIRVDDPDIPPYVLPGPHSGPAGHPAVREGLYQMVVDNYRQAQAYAETYARNRFKSTCTSITRRQSDWTLTLPQAWQNEAGARSTEASVAYDCATSNGPRIVNVYARTSIHGNDGLWMVDPIISIIAKPEDLNLAQQMTQHMINSWQETPRWKQHQEEMTQMGRDQIKRDFGQFMQQMQVYHQQREAAMNQQVSQFESRQQAQAAQVSSWGNTLTGLTNVYDPSTGTQFQVFSGPKSNYYVDGLGDKVNSNVSPGPGFHQVLDMGP
jgi:hypothetical protein